MPTLIIAEKNKAAQAIAEALGSVVKSQFAPHVPIFSVPSRDLIVIPLRGHIQQYENIPAYRQWASVDPREIIRNPAAIAKSPISYATPYIQALKQYGKQCSLCIIATDADVEGCNIGLIDALPFVQTVNPAISVQQLWLNDLLPRSVQAAFTHLISPKWNWAESAEARAIIDAFIGFAASRELTLTLQPILRSIQIKLVSIGRVQSSLLYLIYHRELAIRHFQPVPFWTIDANLSIAGLTIVAHHQQNNFIDHTTAQTVFTALQGATTALLIDQTHTNRTISPPTPLNTSKALILLTQQLKITAAQALKTMEELYLNKIISYPRTDTDRYETGYDHTPLFHAMQTHPVYGEVARTRLTRLPLIPHNGSINAGDHPPITPLIALPLDSPQFETPLQSRVYDLLVRNYLAVFENPILERITRMVVQIRKDLFAAQITLIIDPGFLRIAPFLGKPPDAPIETTQQVIQRLQMVIPQTTPIPVSQIRLSEKATQPLPRFNDTSLIKLMEVEHLGTKSTRPAMIALLIDRGYIEYQGKTVYMKELGFILMQSLAQVWLPFLESTFTARIEARLEGIQNGTDTRNSVVQAVREEFMTLFDAYRMQKAQLLPLFDSIVRTGNIAQGRKKPSKMVGASQVTKQPCPQCHQAPMKLVITQDKQKKFLVCSDVTCKTFLSLPKKGFPALLSTQCALCGFDVVKISTQTGKKRFIYYLCPLCWNQGLHQNPEGGLGFCSKCQQYTIHRGKCIRKPPN